MSQVARFILGFVVVLGGLIGLIAGLASRLGGRVAPRLYGRVEKLLITGLLVGIVGMFQPWALAGYRLGFQLLLASMLGYIVWSHVSPRA